MLRPPRNIRKTIFTAAGAASGAGLLAFAWPSGLVAGKSYRVMVERTDVNGVTRTSAAKTVAVVAGAVAPEPTITGAHSESTADGHVCCNGESVIVEGANLDTATQVDLLDMNGDVFLTADATYADGKLTTEGISFADFPADGSIRVTTAGGSATYDVVYDNY